MYDPDEECKAMVGKLNNICKMKNISLRTLAKKSNVSNSTVSLLLNGKTKPQVYTLLLLCNVLEISIYDLFSDGEILKREADDSTFQIANGKLEFSKLSNGERTLLLRYRHLSDEKKKLLEIFADMLFQYNNQVPM